jgi:hypothetical protein
MFENSEPMKSGFILSSFYRNFLSNPLYLVTVTAVYLSLSDARLGII